MAKLSAIEDINHLLNRAREIDDDEVETGLLINLGNVYANYSDYKMSDTIYRQGLALARLIQNDYLEIVTLINLGLSYKERADLTQAYAYYQKAAAVNARAKDSTIEQEINEHILELENMRDINALSKLT